MFNMSNNLTLISNFLKLHKVGIGYFSFTLFCGIAYYIAYSTNYSINLAGQNLLIVWIVGMLLLFGRNTILEIRGNYNE